MKRKWRNIAILAFLAIQFALPISYYLTRDRFDERFAWRMFSPIRMVRCQVSFFAAVNDSPQQQLSINTELSQPWSNWMRRGHTKIVRAFADYYCTKQDSADQKIELFVDLTCRLPDKTIHQPISRYEDLCRKY
jgi:hypothetical protein